MIQAMDKVLKTNGSVKNIKYFYEQNNKIFLIYDIERYLLLTWFIFVWYGNDEN